MAQPTADTPSPATWAEVWTECERAIEALLNWRHPDDGVNFLTRAERVALENVLTAMRSQ